MRCVPDGEGDDVDDVDEDLQRSQKNLRHVGSRAGADWNDKKWNP